jgi:hypothetical protein
LYEQYARALFADILSKHKAKQQTNEEEEEDDEKKIVISLSIR